MRPQPLPERKKRPQKRTKGAWQGLDTASTSCPLFWMGGAVVGKIGRKLRPPSGRRSATGALGAIVRAAEERARRSTERRGRRPAACRSGTVRKSIKSASREI